MFVSHTSELASWPAGRSCVQSALEAISAADYQGVEMRDFAAQDHTPAETSRNAVRGCDVLVALTGFRYGSLVPDLGISYTELEFDTATTAGIPRIVVMLRNPPDDADATVVDEDRGRIDGFRRRLIAESNLTAALVDNADQVRYAVFQALIRFRDEQIAINAGSLKAVTRFFTGREDQVAIIDATLDATGLLWGSRDLCHQRHARRGQDDLGEIHRPQAAAALREQHGRAADCPRG